MGQSGEMDMDEIGIWGKLVSITGYGDMGLEWIIRIQGNNEGWMDVKGYEM